MRRSLLKKATDNARAYFMPERGIGDFLPNLGWVEEHTAAERICYWRGMKYTLIENKSTTTPAEKSSRQFEPIQFYSLGARLDDIVLPEYPQNLKLSLFVSKIFIEMIMDYTEIYGKHVQFTDRPGSILLGKTRNPYINAIDNRDSSLRDNTVQDACIRTRSCIDTFLKHKEIFEETMQVLDLEYPEKIEEFEEIMKKLSPRVCFDSVGFYMYKKDEHMYKPRQPIFG